MLGSLGQVLRHAARAFSDRTALICEGRSFSFLELDAALRRPRRQRS